MSSIVISFVWAMDKTGIKNRRRNKNLIVKNLLDKYKPMSLNGGNRLWKRGEFRE